MLGPCLSLLTSLSLVLGGVLQFLSLDSAGQVASCLGVGCLLFGVCLPKRFAVTREKVLALLAPWFAVFGLGSTFVLLVAYLLLSFRWTRLSELYGWALPLWAVLVAWQLGWWSVQAEWGMISELASKTDASACLMSALRSRSLPVVSQFYDFCRMLLLMCFIGYFVNFETRRDEVLRWIPWGFGGAVFLSLVQVFSPLGTYFPAQTDFWSGLSRFVGAFEDPNAFGVASFLSVPLLLVSRSQRSKTVHLDVLIAALCLVALYSGSRTFLLGLILFLILSACALFRNGRPPFRALFVMGLLVVGVPLILMFVLDSQSLPNSLVRVKELLVSGDIATALFSRMVFARIGLHEWFDYPLFGIGWGRFGSFVTPYSEYLGLGIGSWSDNANNFYLGILAELGIVGGVALVVSLLFLTPRLAEPCSVNARRGVLCFAVLLMVGPHFLNDSVLFLFSLLVSIGYTTRVLSGMWKHLTLQLLPFFAVLSVLNFQYSEYGFYPWELDSSGFYRWTRKDAQGYTLCEEDGRGYLRLLNARPSASSLWVNIQVEGQQRILSKMDSGRTKTFSFECGLGPWNGQRYSLSVDSVFQPSSRDSSSADDRFLGVMVLERAPETAVLLMRNSRNPYLAYPAVKVKD